MEINLANRDAVRRITAHFKLRARKKWGQNFLIRPDIVTDIAAAAQVGPGDRVLEVGPGIGTLTQGLARTGADVTAVELDPMLPAILAETLAHYNNVRIVSGDILKIDLHELMGDEEYTVAANLPYYITTPILMHFLACERLPKRMILMMQREVAERLAASPGTKDYGSLTVTVQYRTRTRVLFDVPPEAFWPAPKVMSAVIEIIPRDVPPVQVHDEALFFRLIRAAFAQRRKTFRNNLKAAGYTAAESDLLLEKAKIDGKRRGETCTMEEFARLANIAYELANLSK